MAREAKERMKDYRLRKLASERKEAESTLEFLDQPFCDWLRENKGRGGWDGVNLSLDLAGLPPFEIHNDDGPRSYEGIVEAHPDETYEGYAASIGQAENFIDRLIEAAHDAAVVVSEYKQECISRRIAQIEAQAPADEASHRRAISEIVRLTRIRDQLEKQVKKTFPTWKVKGI